VSTIRLITKARGSWLRSEASLTVRLLADNVSAALVPGLLGTAIASIHYRVGGPGMAARLAVSAGVFLLYSYVFDASNQARQAAEDRANKPHRPIPSGLATSRGLMHRFLAGMAVYTLVGWFAGILPWVLLWQADIVGLNLLSRPRHYIFVKWPAMVLGAIAQLAAAWRIGGPLDSTGWTWILVITIAFMTALPFEDVRDMAGDRAIGRRTLALTVGHWPVRIWFAAITAVLPVVLYLLLYRRSHAAAPVILTCSAVVAALSWTTTVRSLFVRTVPADRITYLLFTISYCAALAAGLLLL
jgi:4-hydroxybenzoate polyprenyltransferase